MAIKPRLARLEGLSTAAIVICAEPRFEDADGNPDAEVISIYMTVRLNGQTGEFGDLVTFARNATNAEKQAAVRNRLNAILTTIEVGNTLNNANIQISGLPI